MKKPLFFLVFCCSFCLHAQHDDEKISNSSSASKKYNFGIELDGLPYATGGYFAGAWIGKNQWRTRALLADVNLPDFTTKKGFTNHHVRAYAVLLDRFLTQNWKGWWVGAGPVYWKSTIEDEYRKATKNFENILLNGSIGYNFILYKNLYVSPWAGMSCKIGGNDHFTLENKAYKLPLLNPELSLKIGIFL
ncbi:hypothetical protein ACSVH5_03060 [Flavobacterium sp. RSSA_27]|uniref:hypothetical protein n=1 Tax=Flavobacterium sp. RSSA_27 TaxID=3447667 RepID=UPI003F306DFF